MSSANFTITEHLSPCQYIREFPHGVKSDDAVLQLAVKEYRPRRVLGPSEDAVTIIASHGNGFAKECYEALWDDLLQAENGSFKIRAIWMADAANQGASYQLNGEKLGDDPGWFDHARDLLLMMNHFRENMQPPFVGLAHSMGCANMIWLSILHPRLLQSLILIEPVIQDSAPPGANISLMSSIRRDTWASREIAEKQLGRNPFFASFDPRVLKAYLKHSLRDREDGSVTLATPKAQEAWSFVRMNHHPLPKDRTTAEARNFERLLDPDVEPFGPASTMMFTRPEGVPLLNQVPHLRPRTLLMYGDFSHINFEEIRDVHVAKTGIGPGGNGGIKDGGVEVKIVDDTGHLCCFDQPTAMAADMSVFLNKEMARWKKEKEFWATYDKGTSKNDRKELSDKWIAGVKEDAEIQRPSANGSAKL